MHTSKEINSAQSPLSSYSKTISPSPEDEDNVSNYNLSISSEPIDRKKYLASIGFQNRNSLTINDIWMKNEKDWINTPYCGICEMFFDKFKGVFTHHCRKCGISVCGECSSKKINCHRVCDLCFLRIESTDLIERKEKVLEMKEATYLEIEKNINETKQKIDFYCNKISDFSVIRRDEEKQRIALDHLKSQLKEIAIIMKKNKDNMQNLQENLKNEEELLQKKKYEYERVRKELGRLKEENLRKNFDINHGNEEIRDLMEQIKRTQISQSYIDLSEIFDITKEDLQRTFTQIEFINKGDQNMLENCDLELRNLLKKTFSFQKEIYMSHSLLRSKITNSQIRKNDLENEEKMGMDIEQKPYNDGICFKKCEIF